MPTLTSVVLGDILVLGGLVLLAVLLYDINVRPEVYQNFRREVWYLGSFVGVETVLFGTGFVLRAATTNRLVWEPTVTLLRQYGTETGFDVLLLSVMLIIMARIASAKEITEAISDKSCTLIVGTLYGVINAFSNKEWAAAPHMIATSVITVIATFLLFKLVSMPWRRENITESIS